MRKKKNIPPTEAELVEYFFAFKKLRELHVQCGFGESPHSSSGFTERLCCHFDKNLKPVPKKSGYDLENQKNKTEQIEVKGTVSKRGQTTIRVGEIERPLFTDLFWVILLPDENKVLVNKIKHKSMLEFFKKYNIDMRESIALSKFKKHFYFQKEYSFDESKKIIEEI